MSKMKIDRGPVLDDDQKTVNTQFLKSHSTETFEVSGPKAIYICDFTITEFPKRKF